MKRTGFWVAALFLSLCSAVATAAPVIAFQRDADIWVAEVDGSHPKKIATGSYPAISPDGTRIVFNTGGEKRRIALVEVASKKVKMFRDEIPSDNCFGAIWSPDGLQIIFNIYSEEKWHLGSIRPDGSGFRYLKKSTGMSDSLWSICWAADGASFYGQDLDRIYHFSVEGKELARWEVKKLFPEGAFSSGSRFTMSPDGKRMLMEVEMDEEDVTNPGWDGPPPALWLWEMATGKTTRLTPKGLLATEGCWQNNEKILYVSQTAREKSPVLSEMTLAEKNRKPLLRNAVSPTVSRSPL